MYRALCVVYGGGVLLNKKYLMEGRCGAVYWGSF